MTTSELTGIIKSKAIEIGFHKVGITTAKPFDLEADRLESWLREGANGLMRWIEKSPEKHRDVRNILPESKSIISLALNYYTPTEIPADSDVKISRYAVGTDYHVIIPEMLSRLLGEIKILIPEATGRYYTDTGPLLEKAIAARAGIGWAGKHTNVITREFGSWVFLSEILLDIELIPDPPATDMCGTCTRCIDACPTDAITAAYQLDARRCISYLTIELKADNPIPSEFQPDLKGWIYGCDICQDVCPWNRFEKPTDIPQFAPRQENLKLTPDDILEMSQEEFSSRFRKSPIKRTKLAGLQRNVRATTGRQDSSDKL